MDVEKIGKAIAYLRKRAGYTQKELAERIGISDKAVSKWERGQGLPEIGYLRKLSILLDTDSDSLLSGDLAHHKTEWIGIIALNENIYGIGISTVIYDKPLINILLSYFLLVGIKNIYVSCDETDADFIRRSINDGNEYGIAVTPVIGGVKAIYEFIGSQQIKDKTIMMVYGRCMLYGVDQTRFFQKAMSDRSHFTMLVLPKKIAKQSVTIDVNKKLVRGSNINEIKLRTQYDFSEIPISFFPAVMLKDMVIAETVYDYIEALKSNEDIYVEMLDRGFVEIDINNWNDVHDASTFLRIVQEKCGMNVYCLEEVAWRRGMISLATLKKLGEKKADTEYGEYIQSLFERLSHRVIEP